MSKGSPLLTSIERATSETLLRSDPVFNSAVKEIISSRPDMPKEAVQVFKKRIVARNPKIQILTLDLLDFLVAHLPLPFHTQVSSRDFLMTLSQLYKSRDVDNQVKFRLKDLLTTWHRRFSDSIDILPGFTDIYQQLKLGGEIERPRETEAKPSGSHGFINDSPKKLPESKSEKLRKDFQVVRENINLTNDMVKAKENPNNETLVELVSTLKVMETKILHLIDRLEDADVLQVCLNVKDELQECLERYGSYKSGKLGGGLDLLMDLGGGGLGPSGGGLLDSFGSMGISVGGGGGVSGFATNNTGVDPGFQGLDSRNFYSQPGPSSVNNAFFLPQSNLSFQEHLTGNDVFGLSGVGGSDLMGGGPGFSAGAVKQQQHGNPLMPTEFGFGQGGVFTEPTNSPFIGSGLNDLILPPPPTTSNLGYPAPGSTTVQAKGTFNYKPSEQFEDPFKTSINLNPVRKEQVKSPKNNKEQNFDELFDFKF